MALDFQRPDPSSPAAVASAQFTQTRRGYREEEVRDFLRQVSVEMARLLERERFLENELKALQSRGPVDVAAIDEAAVTELLGAEAARVLTTAREASQAMRERAAESAEQIVRDASREATRLMEEATVEASRRRTDVTGEAEQEIELAKQQGREMIAEVRAYRERVLADIAKRTEEARRELERLVHERERLLSAFERARHAATDVVGDLNEFDEALRATGVTPPLAPPDAPPPPRPTRPSATPIFDAKQYEHELGAGHRADEDKQVEATASAPEQLAPDTTESKLTEPEPTEPESTEPESTEPVLPSPLVPEADVVQLAEVVNISDRRRKKEPTRITRETPQVEAPDHPVFERVEAAPEPERESSEQTPASATSDRVDEIFARLRAGNTTRVAQQTTKDVATDSRSEPVTSTLTPTTPTSTPTSPKAVIPHKVDESVFRRRDEVVNPALEALGRAVKRQLADDENVVLTHVSGKRSSLTLAAMLPSPGEHAAAYSEVICELVTSIAVDAARSISDARRSDMRAAITNGGVLETIHEMLFASFVQPLHARVTDALTAAGKDRDKLLSALRSIFQECKSQQIAAVVSDIAYFTYARGLFLGCDTKSTVCWAVDPRGPACADAEDNSLAGGMRRGEMFPTGHAHPLAHAGCRCLVVPINK
jgi:DivIVA domain-containing protein